MVKQDPAKLSPKMRAAHDSLKSILDYVPEHLIDFGLVEQPPDEKLGTVKPVVNSYVPDNLISKHLNFLDSKTQYRYLKKHTRVTDLDKLCPRKNALHLEYNAPIVDTSITGGMQITWAIGRACEKHIRNQFIRSVGPKYVFGVWGDSLNPYFEHTGFMTDDVVATLKGEPVYDELTVYHEAAAIKGKVDMLVLVGDAIVPVEIKSMAKSQYEKFFNPVKPAGPLGAHVIQLGSYIKICGDYAEKYFPGYSVSTKGILLYCQKEFKFGSPYKEFIVNLKDPVTDGLIDSVFADAYDVKAYIETGDLPVRCLCDDPGSKRARGCDMVKECFKND